jgi:hypothetical protein
VFTYKAEELMDPNSGYWVVAYTELVAKAAAYLLFEVWDVYRLWAMSPDMLINMEKLDLEVVFGNASSADELRRLMAVIRGTNFAAVPTDCRARGQMPSRSPGRQGPGGDWIWYDPSRRELLHSRDTARARANALDRSIPDGFPRGWGDAGGEVGWQEELPNGEDAPGEGGGWDGDVVEGASGVGQLPVDSGGDGAAPAAQAPTIASAIRAAYPALSDAVAAGDVAGVASYVERVELGALRRALEEVGGIPSAVYNSSWDGMIGFLRGRLD